MKTSTVAIRTSLLGFIMSSMYFALVAAAFIPKQLVKYNNTIFCLINLTLLRMLSNIKQTQPVPLTSQGQTTTSYCPKLS